MTPTFQRFDTYDVLALDIERNPAAGELRNLVVNPDGELGAWGWLSPDNLGTQIDGDLVDAGTTQALVLRTIAGQNNYVWTEPIPVTPGRYAAASYLSDHPTGANGAHFNRGRIYFLDDDLDVVDSSPVMAWAPDGTHEIAALEVPVDAVYARLSINIAKNIAGDNVTAVGRQLWINNVKLIEADDIGDLAHPLPDAPTHYLDDVIGLAVTITTSRAPLEANTLTIQLQGDPVPDPGGEGYGSGLYGLSPYGGGGGAGITLDGSSLEAGKLVILRNLDGVGPALFTGKVHNGRIDYDLTKPPGRRARVTLTVLEAPELATKRHAAGYSDPHDIGAILEGAGVPWNVLGDTGTDGITSTDITTPGASVLEQIIRTRDSSAAQWDSGGVVAWVNRDGVLMVRDRTDWPDRPDYIPLAPIHEGIYNDDLVISKDTERIVNSVVVTLLHGTESTEYGPFERAASIAKWGRRTATFTIVNSDDWDWTEARTAAKRILDLMDTPGDVVESVTLPMLRRTSNVIGDPDYGWIFGSTRWLQLDLYDLVEVTNTSPAFSLELEVTSITHSITRNKWLMTLGFGVPGRPAQPTRPIR